MQRILHWCLLQLTFISLLFCKSYLNLSTINKSVIIIIIKTNGASFYLWWKQNLVKHPKVSKYYEKDCSFFYMPQPFSGRNLSKSYRFFLSKTDKRKMHNFHIKSRKTYYRKSVRWSPDIKRETCEWKNVLKKATYHCIVFRNCVKR